MANTITSQTLLDGPRNLVVKVKITGDGSGEESDTDLVDISDFTGPPGEVSIEKIKSSLVGFSTKLSWNATTNVDALDLPVGENHMDFTPYGGLTNNAGTGVNGDILFSTVGLGAADDGTIVLEMRKKA